MTSAIKRSTAGLNQHSISGRVSLPPALSGNNQSLRPTPAATVTDSAGIIHLLNADNYTVTAAKTHYTFNPASSSVSDLVADKTFNFAHSQPAQDQRARFEPDW